jgi:hypothetical protein
MARDPRTTLTMRVGKLLQIINDSPGVIGAQSHESYCCRYSREMSRQGESNHGYIQIIWSQSMNISAGVEWPSKRLTNECPRLSTWAAGHIRHDCRRISLPGCAHLLESLHDCTAKYPRTYLGIYLLPSTFGQHAGVRRGFRQIPTLTRATLAALDFTHTKTDLFGQHRTCRHFCWSVRAIDFAPPLSFAGLNSYLLRSRI